MRYNPLIAKKQMDSRLIQLERIWYELDECNDIVFSAGLSNSLANKGLIYPILVCSNRSFKAELHKVERRKVPAEVKQEWRCLIGNNRLDWARSKGFTHISCIKAVSVDDYKKYMKKTFMEPSEL